MSHQPGLKTTRLTDEQKRTLSAGISRAQFDRKTGGGLKARHIQHAARLWLLVMGALFLVWLLGGRNG